MNAADPPTPLDAKTVALRLWWGRSLLAFTAAWSAAFVVMLLSRLVDGGAASAEAARSFLDSPTLWLNVAFALVAAPFVETGLMAWVIILLSRSIRPRFVVVLISASLWAGLHRLTLDASGWYAFVPFFAFSLVYIRRSREPHRDGFVVATLSHLFFNVMGLLSVFTTNFTR